MSTATLQTLRFDLEKRGVVLKVIDGGLHLDAPAGAIDAELKRRLIEAKPELIRDASNGLELGKAKLQSFIAANDSPEILLPPIES